MPHGSSMIVYGNLSDQKLDLDNWDIVYSKKKVDSLFIGDSLQNMKGPDLQKKFNEIDDDIKKGDKIF
jgi:hypothetical protein